MQRRDGLILVIVLLVITMLSLAALTFAELMLTERTAATASSQQVQAREAAESGIEMARFLLSEDSASMYDDGGWYNNPTLFQGRLVADDQVPQRRSRFAVVAPTLDDNGATGLRYGLEDETARLNLNSLMAFEKAKAGSGKQLLMGLPGMTDEIADSILDWIDSDDDQRELGAEVEYYSTLATPYAPKNGPLETLDELLLVRDVTPALLYGADANRNGMPDANEPNVESLTGVDNSQGGMSRGWSAYLTLNSVEGGASPDGLTRVDLNQSDMQTLYDELNDALGNADWATFIVAYRQAGPYSASSSGNNNNNNNSNGGGNNSGGGGNNGNGNGNNSGGGGSGNNGGGNDDATQTPAASDGAADGDGGAATGGGASGGGGGYGGNGGQSGSRGGSSSRNGSGSGSSQTTAKPGPVNGRQVDLSKPAKTKINSVYDLIDAQVQITFSGEREASIVTSPFTDDTSAARDYLVKLLENCSVEGEKARAGRINVNLAPRILLEAIPGMDSQKVDELLSYRTSDPAVADDYKHYSGWLWIDGVLTLKELKAMDPYITAGGRAFRVQSVGYFDRGGPAARLEAIIDATQSPPRIVSWRDLTHLGRGYAAEWLGVDNTAANAP